MLQPWGRVTGDVGRGAVAEAASRLWCLTPAEGACSLVQPSTLISQVDSRFTGEGEGGALRACATCQGYAASKCLSTTLEDDIIIARP